MARIAPIDPSSAAKDVAEILEDIKASFGMIPSLFLVYARHPPLLQANWNKVKQVMMEGQLSRKCKEAIALLVSMDNGCKYCVGAHSAMLKALGVSDEELQGIMTNLDGADFNSAEKALIGYARMANTAPVEASKEFPSLKESGIDDQQIIEALGVMEVFAAFNRFIDSLDIELS